MEKLTILAPKNRSLSNYVDIALKDYYNAEIIQARGEDIPFLLSKYSKNNVKVIGLTGSDLFKEFQLKSRDNMLSILKKISWQDPNAMFGKPALCLLGPEDKELSQLKKNLKVYINSKYKYISKRYLNYLEEKGYKFQKYYLNGETESTFISGLADLVIDVVYTGNSIKKNKLKVYDKIYESDFIVIGQKTIIPKKSVQIMNSYNPPTASRLGKLRLDFNENTIGCSPNVIEALKNIGPETLSVYPEYNEARVIFSKFFIVRKEQILLANATDEAIRTVFETFIDVDDEVIIPTPTFAMFNLNAELMGAKIIEVLYNEDLSFPTNNVLEKINERTKMVVLVNPNNPTATGIRDDDIIKILNKCKKFNSLVFIDEAYYEFYNKTSLPLINEYDNLIITRTFSKAFGLAGIRLGFLIACETIIKMMQKVISPYSVNQLAIVCGYAAINDLSFVKDYAKEVEISKKLIYKELKELGIKDYPSDANFLIADFGINCKYVCEQLKKRDILVRDRSSYPLLKNCLRMGIGTIDQTKYLLKNLKEILEKKVAIIFDMDGVLVDVSMSYREAIKKTVKFFTGKEISNMDVQNLKNKGGFNDDWEVSLELIKAYIDKKENIPEFSQIINKFQEFYLGNSFDGLILNEKWLLDPSIIENLSKSYILGIVTGRPRVEASHALRINDCEKYFKVLIAMEDIPKGKSKPDPYGIKKALEAMNIKNGYYIGDTIDDLRASKYAGIKFIGSLPSYVDKVKLNSIFMENKADYIIDDINKITSILK